MTKRINPARGQLPLAITCPIAMAAFAGAYVDRGYVGISQRMEQESAQENVERGILAMRVLTVEQLRGLGLQVPIEANKKLQRKAG